jgi:LysR family transcriptional regulator for bpeEF and oprC
LACQKADLCDTSTCLCSSNRLIDAVTACHIQQEIHSAEGERFYERVKEILATIAETTSMFDRSGSTLRGRLRIDIPTAFSQHSFMASLRRFTQAFPEIELALGVTDRTVDLVAEGIDCVLRIGDLPDSSMVAR